MKKFVTGFLAALVLVTGLTSALFIPFQAPRHFEINRNAVIAGGALTPTVNFQSLMLNNDNSLTFNYNVGGAGNQFTATAIYAATNRGQMQVIATRPLGNAQRGANSQTLNTGFGLTRFSNVFAWYVQVCNQNNQCTTSQMQLPRR